MSCSSLPRHLTIWATAVVAVVVLGAWHAPTSPPALDEALASVDSLRTHQQFQAALTRIDSLRRQHPDEVKIQWRRALLRTDLGKQATNEEEALPHYREAQRVAQEAIQTDSTNAWAHLTAALAAGRLTLHVGRSDRVKLSRSVKRHADRAIALDSTLAGAFHLRGRWHREVADLNFVTRTLVRAFYGGLPNASFDYAIRDFKRAIALESKPYNHLELAKTYLEIDRTAEARTQLQTALETQGSPFDAEHKREARTLLAQLR